MRFASSAVTRLRPSGLLALRRGSLLQLGIAWLTVFVVATWLTTGHDLGSKVVSDVLYVAGVGAAASFSVVAAFKAQPHQRVFWRLLAVSNVLWLGGEVVWSVLELGLGKEAPFPSFADVLYLSSYALVLPAILLGFSRTVRSRPLRSLLDTSIVVVAIAYVGWVALIEPQTSWGLSAATATGIAYPLLGVAILMLLAGVGLGVRAIPTSFVLVAVAFLVSALADSAFTYLVVIHEYVPGYWLNLGWQLEAVLMCLAAASAIRGEAAPREALLRRDVGLGVVIAGTASVLVIVASELMDGDLSVFGAALGGFAVVAIVLRMYLTSREKEEIARRLDRSLSLLKATLESTADGIVVVDRTGRISHWNMKFVEMWRIPHELLAAHDDERIRTCISDQIADLEAYRAKLEEVAAAPTADSFDVVECQDGRVFERWSQPQLLDGRSVGRVTSFRDVTVRRRLEEDLRQAQKMEAVGRLAGGIAHDFNNLLTGISGYAEMIEESPSGADVADDAHQIRRAAGRAAELTHQLLAFGGKQVLLPQHVDLTSIVESVEPLLSSLIGTHVHLELDLAPDSFVEVDPAQIEQVLVNLTLNARDSMVDGGVLTIRTVRESDTDVRLEVIDTGEGMSEENLARALEPFFTTKPQGEGTGLGLPTVLGIVEQSGGTFGLTSRLGEGTCASIVFSTLEAQLAA